MILKKYYIAACLLSTHFMYSYELRVENKTNKNVRVEISYSGQFASFDPAWNIEPGGHRIYDSGVYCPDTIKVIIGGYSRNFKFPAHRCRDFVVKIVDLEGNVKFE